MKKLLMLSVLILIITVPLFCNASEKFFLGNYSYWQGMDRGAAKYATAADSVFRYMVECGYDATVCNAYHFEEPIDDNGNVGNTPTEVLLNKIGSAGLKAILTDFTWDGLQTDKFYSTRGLSLSNYQRYEAEYRNVNDVKPNDSIDDKYYYRSRGVEDEDEPLRGGIEIDSQMSNGAGIVCEAGIDLLGYVYNGSVYRWHTKDGENPRDELRDEFQFVKLPWEPDSTLTDYMLSNTYVYITVAFSCPNEGATWLPTIPRDLITLDIINPKAIDSESKRIPFYFGDDDFEREKLTVRNIFHTVRGNTVYYGQLPREPDINTGNRLLTVRIPLSTFADQSICNNEMMLSSKGSDTYVLSEFYVRVYWHGKSTLHLDYIEVEDSIHKEMEENTAQCRTNINNRINKLKSLGPAGVIELLYGFDEPNQPQFDSYELVQNLIDSNQPNFVTAVYDWQRKMEKTNLTGSSCPLDQYYQHQVAFIESVTPKIFSPDIYPIIPQTEWNDKDNDLFVQSLLEKNLLCRYNKFKTEQTPNNDSYKFYPVVQAFGHWKGKLLGIMAQTSGRNPKNATVSSLVLSGRWNY